MTAQFEMGSAPFQITDAQVHVWNKWRPGATPHRPGPFEAADLIPLMDEARVDRAILVPPSWALDGNEVALNAAGQFPNRFKVMGVIDLEASPAINPVTWMSRPEMLGVRLTFHQPNLMRLFSGRELDWLWTVAAASGIPLMVYAPGATQQVASIARRFPSLRVILDHLALPIGARGKAVDDQLGATCKLSPFGNVAVKASSLPLYSDEPYPYADMGSRLQRVLDAFSADRVFWGSDLTRLSCSYQEAVNMMIPLSSGRNLELLMGGALSQWLGWRASD